MTRIVLCAIAAAIVAHAQNALPTPGVISQIVAGGGWETAVTLMNSSSSLPVDVTVTFQATIGLLTLPLIVSNGGDVSEESVSRITRRLAPLATLRIDINSARVPGLLQGFATVFGTHPGIGEPGSAHLIGSAQFSQRLPGGRVSAAVAPLTYSINAGVSLPYDNTAGQATGVALVNLSALDAPLEVVIRDENGARIGTAPFLLRARAHTAFDIATQFGATNRRGFIEFVGPARTQITGLGLRFTSTGTFTSIPVLHAGERLPLSGGQELNDPGVFSHVAAGGGWKTTLTLVNPWSTSQQITLLFLDSEGHPLRLPLVVTARGERATLTNATFSRTIPPLGSVLIETDAPGATVLQGWAAVLSSRTLSGSGVFGQRGFDGRVVEAAVPIAYGLGSSFTLTYDGIDGSGTGVALINHGDNPAEIALLVRHEDGTLAPSTTIHLPPIGHRAFELSNVLGVFPARGSLGFFAQMEGAQVTGIGLRFLPGGGITSLPVFR